MQVKFNDRNIRVRFSYSVGNKTGGKALAQNIKNKKIKTSCEISEKLPDGEIRVLAVGEAVRDPRDTFIKAEGRRRALSRATPQLGDRPLQVAIWDEYFNMHRDGADLQIPDLQAEE